MECFLKTSIDLFVKSWGSKSAKIPIKNHDIEALESRLNIVLPNSYKYLISTYGLVHSPNVFSKIVELGADISEVQDFLSLEDMYSLSRLYEMSGMPKGHVLFASDCQGNMFCFKHEDCASQQQDLPVWFYDRNLGTVDKVSNSFTEWLEKFNEL